jgi:hypothetical protein
VDDFEVGNCHRVGLAVDDFHGALDQWQRVFGAGTCVEPTHDPVAQCDQAVVWMGDLPVLALAPSDPDGVVGRWLDQNGPGVHSLAWEIPDLDAAQEQVRAAGIGITGVHEGQHYFFLHPRDTFGLLLELSDGHIDHDPRTGGTPTGGGGGMVQVSRVVHVTARVPDLAPVAALLEQVLGAQPSTGTDFVVGDLTVRLVEHGDARSRGALHSVTLAVDLDAAPDGLAAAGIGVRRSDPGCLRLDPADTFGIHLELVEDT